MKHHAKNLARRRYHIWYLLRSITRHVLYAPLACLELLHYLLVSPVALHSPWPSVLVFSSFVDGTTVLCHPSPSALALLLLLFHVPDEKFLSITLLRVADRTSIQQPTRFGSNRLPSSRCDR
jgi:hypothetical protein